MTDLGAFLAFGGICAVFGAAATGIAFLYRDERRERAQQAKDDMTFRPTLDRVRPAIEVANHMPPPLPGEPARRAGLVARLMLAAAGIADLLGLSTRLPATGGVVSARRRPDFAGLDTNQCVWPVNPPALPAGPAQPVAPVGRVHVGVDFDPSAADLAAEVRNYGDYLRRHAQVRQVQRQLAHTDTAVLPRIAEEVAG